MNCSDCKRTLEVGDRYIHFTASEWAEAEGLTPLPELDDLMADLMGRSGLGDEMVFCEDCTVKGGKWIPDMVYGDEAA